MCQVRKPTIQPGHSQTQFPKRWHSATEFHGKFLQRILCRTKNGEIVHLLRGKNVPWCAEAKRLQFLFLRFVCCWQTENMENSVSCVGYVNIYDYELVPEKPSSSTYQWVKYPQFHGTPALFYVIRRHPKPPNEGIWYLKLTIAWLLHPLKRSTKTTKSPVSNDQFSVKWYIHSQRAAQKIRQKQSQGPSPTTHVPRACASALERTIHMLFVLKALYGGSWIIMMYNMYTNMCMYICTYIYVQCLHRKIIVWIRFTGYRHKTCHEYVNTPFHIFLDIWSMQSIIFTSCITIGNAFK